MLAKRPSLPNFETSAKSPQKSNEKPEDEFVKVQAKKSKPVAVEVEWP